MPIRGQTRSREVTEVLKEIMGGRKTAAPSRKMGNGGKEGETERIKEEEGREMEGIKKGGRIKRDGGNRERRKEEEKSRERR